MQKRIVTVTCDSTMSSPGNPHNPTPRGIDAVAEEYISAIDAGASICHLHGPYSVDAEIQAGGTKLSGLDGCDMIANDNVRGRSALRGVAARLLRDPFGGEGAAARTSHAAQFLRSLVRQVRISTIPRLRNRPNCQIAQETPNCLSGLLPLPLRRFLVSHPRHSI